MRRSLILSATLALFTAAAVANEHRNEITQVRGIFCDSPESVKTLQRVMLRMNPHDLLSEAIRRGQEEGALCRPWQGMAIYLGEVERWTREDGQLVDIRAYVNAQNAARMFSWMAVPLSEGRGAGGDLGGTPRYAILGEEPKVWLASAVPKHNLEAIEARFMEKLRWAGLAMDKRTHGMEPPVIVMASTLALNAVFYGEEHATHEIQAEAVYHMDTRFLYLNKELDWLSGEHDYILAHEMVHHLQREHGHFETKYTQCIHDSEKEAYHVQNLWVLASGYGEMKSDMGIIFTVRYLCERE